VSSQSDAVRTDPLGAVLSRRQHRSAVGLEPGASVPFQLTVAADSMHLGGVRRVRRSRSKRSARTTSARMTPVGRTPTFLPWVPAGGGFTPTRVAWLVPLVDVPNRGPKPVFPDDHLAASVSTRGRLQTLLAGRHTCRAGHGTSAGTHVPVDPQRAVPVTWAADPALLQSIADMSDGYNVQKGRSSSGGSGQAAAVTWLDALRRALHTAPLGDTLLALPTRMST